MKGKVIDHELQFMFPLISPVITNESQKEEGILEKIQKMSENMPNIFCSFNVDTKDITLFDEKQLAKQSFHIIIEFCLTSHSCNTSKILSLEAKKPYQ